MKTKENKGISLIVLVITIIVIIILAAAVILTLINNNPISEANKARYESDRDNMQSIFTNTVAKVMAQKQGSIKIKAGELNSVKSGESSVVGEVEYILENLENSSNTGGKIIFDNKENTETEYYTGKKLPIYKSGETTWSIDEEGIIKLSVGNNDYSDNSGNNTSSGTKNEDTTISKEEFESLKAKVEEIEGVKKKIEQLEKNQSTFNTTVEQLQTKSNIEEVRAGHFEFGSVSNLGSKAFKVTFSKPMKDTNYSVVVNMDSTKSYWTEIRYVVISKEVDGFSVRACITNSETSGNLTFNYIAVPYN